MREINNKIIATTIWTLISKEIRRFMRIWKQTLLPPAITMSLYFVIFGSITYKDTVRNIEDTGDFTCSLVSEDMFDAMNSSSVPVEPKIDEFNLAGIKKQESNLVKYYG